MRMGIVSRKAAAWLAPTAALAIIPWLVLAAAGYAGHSRHTGLQHDDPGGPTGPHIHWATEGAAHAYVNFVDHTGVNWPVQAKSGLWNQANHMEVNYKTPSDFCGSHCVSVEAHDLVGTCAEKSGVAIWYYNVDSGHMNGSSFINFNTKCNDRSDFYRGEVTCQELGHIVGSLRHRDDTSTCMHQDATEATQASPDSHDYDTVQSHIYDHNN
jgi:hypothetical protein